MNRLEIQKLLAGMEMLFANFRVEDERKTAMIDTWLGFLEQYDYADVKSALMEYVETSNSSFAPSMPQLIGIIKKHKVIPVKLSFLEPAEAWALVRTALQRSAYESEAQFQKLPKMVQKAVGSANQLHVWATDDDYNEGVIASNFKANYKVVCDRELQYKDLTAHQKEGVDNLRNRLNAGEDFQELLTKNPDEISFRPDTNGGLIEKF